MQALSPVVAPVTCVATLPARVCGRASSRLDAFIFSAPWSEPGRAVVLP